MKIIYINKQKLFLLIIILSIIIFSIVFYNIQIKNSEETFKEDIFYKGNINEKAIAFTCNIDWGNEHIPEMLSIFEKEDIKITFFITGKWAEKNGELVREIYSHKHEIGNHGYSHNEYGKLSYEDNIKGIEGCHEVLNTILDEECKYFAPPAGSFNENTIKAAKKLNYDIIMWSIDTIDWRDDSTKEKIIYRVLNQAENSAIVLMHPTEETIKALPTIIKSLKKEGYTITNVSQIIK